MSVPLDMTLRRALSHSDFVISACPVFYIFAESSAAHSAFRRSAEIDGRLLAFENSKIVKSQPGRVRSVVSSLSSDQQPPALNLNSARLHCGEIQCNKIEGILLEEKFSRCSRCEKIAYCSRSGILTGSPVFIKGRVACVY